MSLHTAEPTTEAPAGGAGTRGIPARDGWSVPAPFRDGRVYLWITGSCLLVASLSLLLPSTPSYDPWAWLVWGREIVHGTLHTTGGPTWKPLPVLFTTVLALFGSAAPNLWLVVARAGAAVAALMTFKLAMRLTWWLRAGHDATRRDPAPGRLESLGAAAPAVLAGTIALIGLVLSGNLLVGSALGYSEGLATAAILIALERHLDGHPTQAFALGFLAALDRPEIWAFWGPYGLWLMWHDPRTRGLVVGLGLLTLALWFVPQEIGGGSFISGVIRAQHPRPNSAAFASCPFCTELADHAWTLVLLRIKAAAMLVIGIGGGALVRAWRQRGRITIEGRRERALLNLVLCGAFGYLWWIIIALETQAGFSGNDRYLVIGSAFIEICGAGGFGWAAIALTEPLRHRVKRRLRRPGACALASAATLALAFMVVPNWVGGNLLDLPATHRALVYQATLRRDLVALIRRAGGPERLKHCGAGHIMVEGFQVPMAAWYFGVRTLDIEEQPVTNAVGEAQPPTPWPNVIFQDRDTGSAALLPLPSTILDWERAGAKPFKHMIITREMFFFRDCAPQRNDPPQQFQF
jgi:hypothetical protein